MFGLGGLFGGGGMPGMSGQASTSSSASGGDFGAGAMTVGGGISNKTLIIGAVVAGVVLLAFVFFKFRK